VTDGRSRKSEPASSRPPPPSSLTRCWDRARWHVSAPSFPQELGEAGASAHIGALLGFLDDRGLLTAAGKRELKTGAASVCESHVRPAARAFLDEAYDAYLARTRYGEPPPIAWVIEAFRSYEDRFDLARRVQVDPFTALVARTEGRTLDDVLWEVRGDEAHLAAIEAALAFVPAGHRPLVDATIALNRSDPLGVARRHADPALVLHALRYLTRERRVEFGLRAAAILAVRLDLPPPDGAPRERLVALGVALDLATGDPAAELAAWRRVPRRDQARLESAWSALASGTDEERELARAVSFAPAHAKAKPAASEARLAVASRKKR